MSFTSMDSNVNSRPPHGLEQHQFAVARVNLAIAKLPASTCHGCSIWRSTVPSDWWTWLIRVSFVLDHGKTVQMIVDSNLTYQIEHNKSVSLKLPTLLGMDPRGVEQYFAPHCLRSDYGI